MKNFLDCDGKDLIAESEQMIASSYTEADIEALSGGCDEVIFSARDEIREIQEGLGIIEPEREDESQHKTLAREIVAKRSIEKALERADSFLQEYKKNPDIVAIVEFESFLSGIADVVIDSDQNTDSDKQVAADILNQIGEHLSGNDAPLSAAKAFLEVYRISIGSYLDSDQALNVVKSALVKKEEKFETLLDESLRDFFSEFKLGPNDLPQELVSTIRSLPSLPYFRYKVENRLVKLQAEKGLFDEAKETAKLIPDSSEGYGSEGHPLKAIAIHMAKAGFSPDAEDVVRNIPSMEDKISVLEEISFKETNVTLFDELLSELEADENISDSQRLHFKDDILSLKFKLALENTLLSDAKQIIENMGKFHQACAYRDMAIAERELALDPADSIKKMREVYIADCNHMDYEDFFNLAEMEVEAGDLEMAKNEAENIDDDCSRGMVLRSIVEAELNNGNLVAAKDIANEILDSESASDAWCKIAEFEIKNGLEPLLSYERAYQELKGLEKGTDEHAFVLSSLAIGKARMGVALILKSNQ